MKIHLNERLRICRAAVSIAAISSSLVSSTALCQTTTSQIKSEPATQIFTFDVATIRQNQSDEHARSHIYSSAHDGRFDTINVPVKMLLQFAYGIPESQISGLPGGLGSEKFDIVARSDTSVDDQMSKLNSDEGRVQKQRMVQALLADRFKLALHKEIKQLPVFDLVGVKNNAKLQESKTEGKTYNTRYGQIDDQGATITALAEQLAQQLGRPVIDKTALPGRYDILLKWAPDNSTTTPAAPDAGPSIFTAIQEQLGLKLESTKGPVEVLVIDHMEEPSPN